MTKYKINLVEAKNEATCGCPFGRVIDYAGFNEELSILVELLNQNTWVVSCKKYSDTSIVIESKISTTNELLERIKPEFNRRVCRINYDILNPIKIYD